MLIFPFRIMLSETIYHVILTAQFYARILFIFVNIYCQPSIRTLGHLEKFPFFIMSSLDPEYNNFSIIQFLLSNIMTLVLSLFNIYPDSFYLFLLARAFGVAVGYCGRLIFLYILFVSRFLNDGC